MVIKKTEKNMNTTYEKTKYKTLVWADEDWVDLFFISSFVKEFYHYKELEIIKKLTLAIIQNLLEEKLVKPGYLYESG